MRRSFVGRLRWLLPAVVLAACVAHVGWWYWPRPHRASPRGLPAALLSDSRLADAVWVAYPHQNLARLEGRAGDIGELAAHAATLLGAEPPALPRFAFWPVPPARALAWARSGDGEAEIVVLEPYPVVRWLARAAGRLAGNPWLAGGAVDEDPAAGRVSWQSGTWIFERGSTFLSSNSSGGVQTRAERLREAAREQRSFAAPEESRKARLREAAREQRPFVAPEGSRKALAWVRVGAGHPPWPVGLYRLQTVRQGVELTHGPAFGEGTAAAIRQLRDRSVLIAVGAGDGGAGAVALVRPTASRTGLQLPGAVLVERGDSGLELPGARLLEGIGVRPHEGDEGGYRIRSWDRGSLALGSELVRGLRPADRAGELPRLTVWADVDEVGEWAEALGGALRVVPFIDPEPARRWLAFAALARAAGPRASLWVEIDDSRGAARVALRHENGAVD